MKRAPHERNQPASSLLRNLFGLAFMLSVLFVTGCTGIPSKMYTTQYADTFAGMEPDPCDTFTYGQHPIVVVQGFEHVHEATLEILTNGIVVKQQTIPLHSGQVTKTSITPVTTYDSFSERYVQRERMSMVVTLGAKIDLGVVPPGVYGLDLKTNNAVAAVASFKVVLPARLEALREELESDRLQLQRLVDEIKQENVEIEQEKSKLDPTNPAMVDAFNAKIAHHNELVKQAQAARDQFNRKIQTYNNDLKDQQRLIPPF